MKGNQGSFADLPDINFRWVNIKIFDVMILISMAIFLNHLNIFSRSRCLSKSKMKKNTIYDYPQRRALEQKYMINDHNNA